MRIGKEDIDLVVFDLDGVFTDYLHGECLLTAEILEPVAMMQKTSIEIPPEGLRLDSSNWINDFRKAGFETDRNEIVAALSELLFIQHTVRYKAHEWMPEFIDKLCRKRPLGILTDNSFASLKFYLGEHRLKFNFIKTYENVSALKPDPEGLLAICREAKIAPVRTMLIGDSIGDIKTGKSAGTKTALACFCPLRSILIKIEIELIKRNLIPDMYFTKSNQILEFFSA